MGAHSAPANDVLLDHQHQLEWREALRLFDPLPLTFPLLVHLDTLWKTGA